MNLYPNIKAVMTAKNITRKVANSLLWTQIFELPRPIGDGVCYVCMDEVIGFVSLNVGQMFTINRGRKNKKWTKKLLGWLTATISPAGINIDKEDKLAKAREVLNKYN